MTNTTMRRVKRRLTFRGIDKHSYHCLMAFETWLCLINWRTSKAKRPNIKQGQKGQKAEFNPSLLTNDKYVNSQ